MSGVEHLVRSQKRDIDRLKGALEKRDREIAALGADLRATKDALKEVVRAAANAPVSLRDVFAGQSMTVWMATFAEERPVHPANALVSPEWAQAIADASYRLADAMVEARGEQP